MATAGALSINFDSAQVERLIERAPAQIQARLSQLIEAGAILMHREVRLAAPVGVTGQTRNSVIYTMDQYKLQAEVKPTVSHAEDLEYGGPPRLLSVAEGTPLRQWADFKGIDPYAVQAAIADHGTQPHPFVGPTFDANKSTVEANIARGVTQFAEELDRGI